MDEKQVMYSLSIFSINKAFVIYINLNSIYSQCKYSEIVATLWQNCYMMSANGVLLFFANFFHRCSYCSYVD